MEEAQAGAAPAVADELVIPEAKAVDELVVASPDFVKFRDGLAEMFRQAYRVTFDLTKTRDNDSARKLRKSLISTRTAIEQARLDGNRQDRESVAERITRRDDLAAKLIEAVRNLETPIDEAIKADEARREREKEEARQREESRIAGHISGLNNIKAVAERAVDLPAADIEQKIALVAKMTIGEDWEEFQSKAQQTKDDVLARLTDLLERARRLEAERAQAEANARELARLQAEQREREQREAAERAERERQERERQAAEAEERRRQEAIGAAVRTAIDGIREAHVSALSLSAAQLGDVIERIAAMQADPEWGDLIGSFEHARDSAVAQLTDLRDEKAEREKLAEQERRRAERQARIDANMRQFNVVQFQGTHDEADSIRAALERIRSIEITEEAFGDQVGLAGQLKDGLMVRLELKLNAALEAPPPPPPAETPAPVAETPAEIGETTVAISGTEGARSETPNGWNELDDPSACLPAVKAWRITEVHQMHAGLLAAVAKLCREARYDSRSGPVTGPKSRFFVPGMVMVELQTVLAAVELPGGLHYTSDGVLRNADGTEHILEEA